MAEESPRGCCDAARQFRRVRCAGSITDAQRLSHFLTVEAPIFPVVGGRVFGDKW